MSVLWSQQHTAEMPKFDCHTKSNLAVIADWGGLIYPSFGWFVSPSLSPSSLSGRTISEFKIFMQTSRHLYPKQDKITSDILGCSGDSSKVYIHQTSVSFLRSHGTGPIH